MYAKGCNFTLNLRLLDQVIQVFDVSAPFRVVRLAYNSFRGRFLELFNVSQGKLFL